MGRAGFPEWWGNVWFPLGDVSHASADKGVWACEEAAVTHLFQTSSSSSKASAPQAVGIPGENHSGSLNPATVSHGLLTVKVAMRGAFGLIVFPIGPRV